jgi:DNA polymerase III alpha subunit
MQVRVLGGYSSGDRHAAPRHGRKPMAEAPAIFRKGAAEKGHWRATNTLNPDGKFAGYGFNKSHACWPTTPPG